MLQQLHTPSASEHFYPLQELEQMADVFLSSANIDFKAEEFDKQLKEQAANLQLFINTQALALGREEEIRQLIQRYHASLTRLLDQVTVRWNEKEVRAEPATYYFGNYTKTVEAIINHIDNYFHEHHSPQQTVPILTLCRQRKELVTRLGAIEQKILAHPEEMVAGEIFKRLRHFAASSRPVPFRVRYRDIRYKEELLRHLEEIRWKNEPDALFTPVEHMLVYLNYNSKAFIKLLTKKILRHVDSINDRQQKLDIFLRYQKAFRQILPKPGLVLNPGYHHLTKALNDWFAEEIRYLEKILQWSPDTVTQPEVRMEKKNEVKVLQKVLVKLSSDQAGLILRAADDLRILVARSLSEVFKTIVPHLSTLNRPNPSYKGMRTQAYVAEERDKEIAIETLERIINKIKEY